VDPPFVGSPIEGRTAARVLAEDPTKPADAASVQMQQHTHTQ
jgi:hypothetical protein